MSDSSPSIPPSVPPPGYAPPAPPPPPPPPPPPDPGRFRDYEAGAMVAAVVLWLATAIAAVLLLPDATGAHDSAYEFGRKAGAFTGGLLIAAVIRLIYVRLTPWGRGLPDVAPAFFVLAAVVTVLGMGGRYALDEREIGRYVANADACSGSERSPLSTAPARLTLAPIPPAAQARFDQLAAESTPGEVTARVEFKQVVVDGRVAAVAIGIPGVTEADRNEFEHGLIDGMGLPNAGIEPTAFGRTPGLLISSSRGTAIAAYPGCWSLVVFGADREAAEGVTRALVGSRGAQSPAAASAASSKRSSPQNT